MKDPVLALVVIFAESDKEVETEITLLVGGFLVSGTVISGKKYMEQMYLTSAISKETDKARSETPPNERREDDSPNFIHLRDAKFITPGMLPIPRDQGVFWRGSLESIDGFFFGTLFSEGPKKFTATATARIG